MSMRAIFPFKKKPGVYVAPKVIPVLVALPGLLPPNTFVRPLMKADDDAPLNTPTITFGVDDVGTEVAANEAANN